MLCFLCRKTVAVVFGMFPLCRACFDVKVRKTH